jgi:predicted methyltransferase
MMRAVWFVFFLAAAAASADVYQDAVDHPGRPGSDREDDDRRKPAEVMRFSGVSAGEVVLEIGSGRGYTTELASRIVGESGKVYAHRLDPARVIGNRLPNVVILPNEPSDPNERFATAGVKAGSVTRVLAFFSLHDGYLGSDINVQQWYGAILGILKPGGEFVVLDNSARPGSGIEDTASLHRIDEEFLRQEILDAGFEFVAESDLLRNPDDDLESSWFDDTETRPAGYQDRFAYRFRKP